MTTTIRENTNPGPNGLDIECINPRNGERYSPNLHRWLSRDNVQRRLAKVYIDAEETLWVGFLDDGWLHGTRLMSVLCIGRQAKACAYPPGNIKGLREVTGFWDNYMRIGRCAIDQEHRTAFMNADTRFIESGDLRTCTWCGHEQRRLRFERTVTCERWVSREPAAAGV